MVLIDALEQAGLGPSGPGFWFLLAFIFAGAFLVAHAFRLSQERRAAREELERARRELSELGHIKDAVATTDRIIREEIARMRDEAEKRGDALREKIHEGMEGTRAALDGRLVAFSEAQSKSINERMGLFTDALKNQ
ncbi:MAG TPA: hypothetical protein PLV61_12750, partial [Parvularculaceae bacterium]|nr:hypothetical protein [Parvularculaceae bacterium]